MQAEAYIKPPPRRAMRDGWLPAPSPVGGMATVSVAAPARRPAVLAVAWRVAAPRAAVLVVTLAGVGWLYLLRAAHLLGVGPRLREALPLQRLAGCGRPAARGGCRRRGCPPACGRRGAAGARRPAAGRCAPWRRGLPCAVLLIAFGAAADAITETDPLGAHLGAQPQRLAIWLAAALVALGAGAVSSALRRRRCCCALAAAVALNGSYLLQHAGSTRTSAIDPRRPLRTLAALLRSPAWALGAVVGVTGWALHIGAMREAPLSLVQAFVAGGLALAVPMAAIGLGQRLAPGERQALGADGAGAGAARARAARATPDAHTSRGPRWAPGWSALGALAGLVVARAPGARRPAALGLAGGAALRRGRPRPEGRHRLDPAHAYPWVAAAALATVGAFFAFQRGLQTGRALPVIALMTAATNVGSIAGAFVVSATGSGARRSWRRCMRSRFGLVLVAAWGLAPAQARLVSPAAGRWRSADVDVAARRVRVRADLVGAARRAPPPSRRPRRGSDTSSSTPSAKRAVLGRRRARPWLSIATSPASAFAAARDHADRALEAGRVADREQLLGVRAAALAAHLRGRAQLDVEHPVVGAPVPVGAPAGDRRLCRVEDLRHAVQRSGPALPIGRPRWETGAYGDRGRRAPDAGGRAGAAGGRPSGRRRSAGRGAVHARRASSVVA